MHVWTTRLCLQYYHPPDVTVKHNPPEPLTGVLSQPIQCRCRPMSLRRQPSGHRLSMPDDRGRYAETRFSRSPLPVLVKLHILCRQGRDRVFGLEMIRALARHRHGLSPGTLYPLLHRMPPEALRTVNGILVAGRTRECYTLTPAGAEALGVWSVGSDYARQQLRSSRYIRTVRSVARAPPWPDGCSGLSCPES